MLAATIRLRADTLSDLSSVIAIINQAGLPVSVEELILHEKSHFGGAVKPPSSEEIYLMVEEWKKNPGLPSDKDKLWDHAPSDEEYLAECIRKGTESWKGVDIDQFLDEMRGRDEEEHF